MQSINWRKHWPYATCGIAGLAVVGVGAGQLLRGLPPAPAPPAVAPLATPAVTPVKAESKDPAEVLNLAEATAENVILAQRKRVMGRLKSLEHVSRVATTIRPLVDRALETPSIQDDLRVMARAAGMSVTEYKKYFAGKQEADLLLESGGDPNARSIADAIGVAQFLAGTGRICGLKVNSGASDALCGQITALEGQIAALEAQPDTWSKAVPSWLRDAVPTVTASKDAEASVVPAAATTSDEGVWSREQWLAYRRMQLKKLNRQRMAVDERYDPAKAILAQTKYLVKLTHRYGGIDWALQAYHGGEGGASRTMNLFLQAGGGRTMLASRGLTGERWLPYTELYRQVTPTGAPAAFSYLFGRSDDHRYYWWKVLMAEKALDLYREDPKEFQRQWQELKPGYGADIAWYPEPKKLEFADNGELKEGYAKGTLVRFPAAAAGRLGLRTAGLAALEPESAGLHKGLRPEGMGAALRLAHIYRSHGGAEPLVLTSMVQTADYRAKWNARYPPAPLPPDIPRDPETHTTGLTFDVRKPSRDWDRKVLEFAMGRLYDNLRISWRKEGGGYHVVVNPEHRQELAKQYAKLAK